MGLHCNIRTHKTQLYFFQVAGVHCLEVRCVSSKRPLRAPIMLKVSVVCFTCSSNKSVIHWTETRDSGWIQRRTRRQSVQSLQVLKMIRDRARKKLQKPEQSQKIASTKPRKTQQKYRKEPSSSLKVLELSISTCILLFQLNIFLHFCCQLLRLFHSFILNIQTFFLYIQITQDEQHDPLCWILPKSAQNACKHLALSILLQLYCSGFIVKCIRCSALLLLCI